MEVSPLTLDILAVGTHAKNFDNSPAHDLLDLDCFIVICHPGGGANTAVNSRSKTAARSDRD
jgi:hypothetical protein